jgi:hypothetical protein
MLEIGPAKTLLDATAHIIQDSDGPADTTCPVNFRIVNLDTFHIGNGVVASWWDFQDVFGMPWSLVPPPESPDVQVSSPTSARSES